MHISALFVYPIKSCRGISVSTANVYDIGLEYDRRYMVVGPDNVFLTQRDEPSMATIEVAQVASGWSVRTESNGALTWEPRSHGPRFTVQIWKDQVEVVDQGDNVAEWFSDALGRPCRLVGFAPKVRRFVDQTYAVAPTDAVSFADGYASLIVTEESLAELNARTSEAVPMSRFRPNIVVHGAPVAWAEDTWRDLQVGTVSMTAVKKCARCVMTTTDQQTGQRHAEPLKTLASYRHIGHGVIFGQNLVHRTSGMIQVGDAVTVSATNE